MSVASPIDAALARLRGALDRLEAVADRQVRHLAERGDRDEELAIMQDDRTRLAIELDGALARVAGLENAQDDVARRVARASAAIETVLADREPPDHD